MIDRLQCCVPASPGALAPRSVERRVTPWKSLWFKSDHYTHVRIWQEFDGVRWWQMHEWRREDGSSFAENWIIGTRGWSKNAAAATEAAPGDRPSLTADEIAYLIERLAGVNDPIGASALAKLEAML
ncbi:hypothetical protein [Pararhizobium haloflavum]|uniref:hypothetical protein n=1 Tax=Pararhizobium haloflavum TaxID=2037914 RepID=UPI000C19BF2C|nr:hypothetical protein [Pararhizobium haloflavum]